jgi:hypothetical protein
MVPAMKKKIISTDHFFFDTDCLSTFLLTDTENFLFRICPNAFVPKTVYVELSRISKLKTKTDFLLRKQQIVLKDIILRTSEFDMYCDMISDNEMNIPIIGKGEAAVITFAYYNNGVVASNNLRDILFYVNKYHLDFITTADILTEFYDRQFIGWLDMERLWKRIAQHSLMPNGSFSEYYQSLKD